MKLKGTCNPGDTLVLAAIAGSDAGMVRLLPTAAGTYWVYDRRLGLVNGTQSPGGMQAALSVSGTGVATVAPTILVPPASRIAS